MIWLLVTSIVAALPLTGQDTTSISSKITDHLGYKLLEGIGEVAAKARYTHIPLVLKML
jgi:hypothetical protein